MSEPAKTAGAPARRRALAEGVLVTLLLGATLVVAKRALAEVGPLTLTALRYTLAALVLLPLLVRRGGVRRWAGRIWWRFVGLGLGFYVVGNWALLVGLQDLPATTAALLLSQVPLLVLLGGLLWLREVPTRGQLAGVGLALAGSVLFFARGLGGGNPRGLAIVAVGLLGNATLGLGGRDLARTGRVDTVALTAVPLALGAAVLLPLAIAREGLPHLTPAGWVLVACLGAVNTAGAYLLYNHALRTLAAFELSTVLSLTPLVTALGAWVLLGERLSLLHGLGLLVVIGGVALVQRRAVSPR